MFGGFCVFLADLSYVKICHVRNFCGTRNFHLTRELGYIEDVECVEYVTTKLTSSQFSVFSVLYDSMVYLESVITYLRLNIEDLSFILPKPSMSFDEGHREDTVTSVGDLGRQQRQNGGECHVGTERGAPWDLEITNMKFEYSKYGPSKSICHSGDKPSFESVMALFSDAYMLHLTLMS